MNHKILTVVADFYPEIAENLLRGSKDCLKNTSYSVRIEKVPGVFEIPAAIAKASTDSIYAGYIALGCVIRGETSHFEYVCLESSRAIMELSLKGLPIGFGILTVENYAQAIERAGGDKGNKGFEASKACISMIELFKRLSKHSLDQK